MKGDEKVFVGFPFPRMVIPEVEVDGDVIRWRPGGTRLMGPLNRVLYDFTKLKKATDVQVFVKKYGPLYLCEEHGWPVGHRPPDHVFCPPRFWKERGELFLGERVARYRQLSDWASEILKIAEKARVGAPLTPAELRATALADNPKAFYDARGEVSETVSVDSVSRVWELVNVWLRLGDPRPWLAPPQANGVFKLEFRSGHLRLPPREKMSFPVHVYVQIENSRQLFAALAMQLASHVSGGMGLTTCDACGALYVPKRTPIQGRKHFCSRCGKAAAIRLWKREHGRQS